MFYTNAFEDYENVGLGLDSLQSSKGSSIFGESLRVAPRSSMKVSNGKNASLVTKCEIGDSLVSECSSIRYDEGILFSLVLFLML